LQQHLPLAFFAGAFLAPFFATFLATFFLATVTPPKKRKHTSDQMPASLTSITRVSPRGAKITVSFYTNRCRLQAPAQGKQSF
jgi:hypothetical protein